MMEHIEIQLRLDEYLDGDLPLPQRTAVEQHLDGCAECRREVDALRELRAGARALPRGIAPPRDLWPEIRARIEAPAPARVADGGEETPGVLRFRPRSARPDWRRWSALAAAAVVLVMLSSGATALLMRARSSAPVAAAPAAVAPAATPRATTALVAFRPAELEYLDAVQVLEAELQARRHQLAPQTVTVIETNLAIIDQAIQEARAALEADPSNPDLPLHLSGVYRRKVELLQSAVLLPART